MVDFLAGLVGIIYMELTDDQGPYMEATRLGNTFKLESHNDN